MNLCPWAAPSLAAQGAVQYVLTSASSEEDFVKIISSEAESLLRRGDDVDVNTAITFIVAPCFEPESFPEFYDFVVWLDEEYLESASPPSEYLSEDEDCRLGDFVIAAGFHPLWSYSGEDPSAPVHFEKRSPFPTVSLVYASAIDGLEASTIKIGEHNRKVLTELGEEKVQQMYSDVIGDNAST